MKYLLILLSFITHVASATLITMDTDKVDYATNEAILLNIDVTDMLVGAAELELEIAFDPATVTFDFLEIAPTSGVFLDFSDANAGILTINTWWFSAFDVPSGGFSLATAMFAALSDVSPVFSLVSMRQYDEAGVLVQPTTVDEPVAFLLLATGLALMTVRRNKAKI